MYKVNPLLTEEGLQTGTALHETISGVRGREEDSWGQAVVRRFEAESDGSEQVTPAGDRTYFLLDAVLRRIHWVALTVADSLQRFLHLK